MHICSFSELHIIIMILITLLIKRSTFLLLFRLNLWILLVQIKTISQKIFDLLKISQGIHTDFSQYSPPLLSIDFRKNDFLSIEFSRAISFFGKVISFFRCKKWKFTLRKNAPFSLFRSSISDLYCYFKLKLKFQHMTTQFLL